MVDKAYIVMPKQFIRRNKLVKELKDSNIGIISVSSECSEIVKHASEGNKTKLIHRDITTISFLQFYLKEGENASI